MRRVRQNSVAKPSTSGPSPQRSRIRSSTGPPTLSSELFGIAMILFPLPMPFPDAGDLCAAHHTSRSVQRRLRRRGGTRQTANDAVMALNRLESASGKIELPRKPTAAHLSVHKVVSDSCERLGWPTSDCTPVGAFVELCNTAPPYLSEGGDPSPYQRGLVALPDACHKLVNSDLAVGPVHAKKLYGPSSHMLATHAVCRQILEDCSVSKPYVDPAFQEPLIYAQFLLDCHERKMLSWSLGSTNLLGIFFVTKKMVA